MNISPKSEKIFSTRDSSDRARQELKWDSRTENVIQTWQDRAISRAISHDKKGYIKKAQHQTIGLLAITTPILFALASQLSFEDVILKNILNIIGFSLSSMLTAIFGFLRLETAMHTHFEYSARFDKYAIHLTSELAKPKAFRTQCDVFLKESELELVFIEENAPP